MMMKQIWQAKYWCCIYRSHGFRFQEKGGTRATVLAEVQEKPSFIKGGGGGRI